MKAQTKPTRTMLVVVLSWWTVSGADLSGADTTAAPPDSSFMRFLTQDYLLGTWGGGRTWLSERGADFEFFYIGSVPSTVSGGRKIETVYQGLLAMTLDLD